MNMFKRLFAICALMFAFNAEAAPETEYDINITDPGNWFVQIRNGVWVWDKHLEFYKNIPNSNWQYGVIWQDRPNTENLLWHQMIYSLPNKIQAGNFTISNEFKLNYIPEASIGPKGFGAHWRVVIVQKLSDHDRIQTFFEPRWQDMDGFKYFGHKSRITWDHDWNNSFTTHLGWTWYGTPKEEWNAEEEFVVMLTFKF